MIEQWPLYHNHEWLAVIRALQFSLFLHVVAGLLMFLSSVIFSSPVASVYQEFHFLSIRLMSLG